MGAAGSICRLVTVIEEKGKQVKVEGVNHSGDQHGNTLFQGTSGCSELRHITLVQCERQWEVVDERGGGAAADCQGRHSTVCWRSGGRMANTSSSSKSLSVKNFTFHTQTNTHTVQSGITLELKNDESLTCTSDVGGSRWVGGWRRVVELEPPSTDDAQKPVPTLLPPLTTPVCSPSTRCVRAPMCVWVVAEVGGGSDNLGVQCFECSEGVPKVQTAVLLMRSEWIYTIPAKLQTLLLIIYSFL